jgi:uridine phosphorylase
MFSPSELILNPDGSIYHLHLLPEQLAPTVILVGDPERVPVVSARFDTIEHRVQKREFVTHTGRIGRKPITVISTGIGTDNIDIVLNELDALVNIDLQNRILKPKKTKLNMIRIGTSGSIQANIPVNSFLVSDHAIGMDGLLHFYKKQKKSALLAALKKHMQPDWDFPIKPYIVPGSAKLIAQFGVEMLHGITATNSGFYAPQGRSLRITTRAPNYVDLLAAFGYENQRITNLEMETAGIYGLAQLMGHEAVSLNAILANRASGQFSQDATGVVEKLIDNTLARL